MTIQEIKDMLEAARKAMRDNVQDAIKGAFRDFFAETDGLVKAVTWQQYTPYWNDGDACTFGVYDPEYVLDESKLDPSLSDAFEYGLEEVSDWDLRSVEESVLRDCTNDGGLGQIRQIRAAVQKLQPAFDEDLMEAAFGDHVTVTATVEGFEIDACDHG